MKNVFRIALLVTGAVLLSGSLPVFAQDIDIPPNIKPFIMPVAGQSGPSTWLMGQPYGNTTGAFNSGADQYSAGQFMHFGIDISMPCGTPLLAATHSLGLGMYSLMMIFHISLLAPSSECGKAGKNSNPTVVILAFAPRTRMANVLET
jgi:hypothetical protein